MRIGRRTFEEAHQVAVMAIVNTTPDSFYRSSPELGAALEMAHAHLEAGADVLDVGGVKAGPGDEVDTRTETARVLPVVEALRGATDAPLSIDTFRPEVAEAALAAGADLVNDTSGLADERLAEVAAAHEAGLVVMHAGGPVRTRPYRSHYLPDVVTYVRDTLAATAARALESGVPADRLLVDPGHDFRKNTLHSLALTRHLPEIAALGYPVLVALSNKDFLGETLGLPLGERVEASLAATCAAVMLGARVVRVHETAATVRALRTVEAILGWREPVSLIRGLE